MNESRNAYLEEAIAQLRGRAGPRHIGLCVSFTFNPDQETILVARSVLAKSSE